jgi:hypothetical protein
MGQFGISPTDAEKIAQGGDFMSIFNKQDNNYREGTADFASQAPSKVGDISKSAAKLETVWQNLGSKSIEGMMERLNAKLQEWESQRDKGLESLSTEDITSAVREGVKQGIESKRSADPVRVRPGL